MRHNQGTSVHDHGSLNFWSKSNSLTRISTNCYPEVPFLFSRQNAPRSICEKEWVGEREKKKLLFWFSPRNFIISGASDWTQWMRDCVYLIHSDTVGWPWKSSTLGSTTWHAGIKRRRPTPYATTGGRQIVTTMLVVWFGIFLSFKATSTLLFMFLIRRWVGASYLVL